MPKSRTNFARRIQLSGLTSAKPARRLGKSASPNQNPRLMSLVRVSAMDLVTHISEQNAKITNQFGTANLVVWAELSQAINNQPDGCVNPPAQTRICG